MLERYLAAGTGRTSELAASDCHDHAVHEEDDGHSSSHYDADDDDVHADDDGHGVADDDGVDGEMLMLLLLLLLLFMEVMMTMVMVGVVAVVLVLVMVMMIMGNPGIANGHMHQKADGH